MPTLMPSLVKYFLTIGALLFVGLIGLNAVLEPGGGPGVSRVQDSPKAKLVRHDPRASLVERLREEEAAQRASGNADASGAQPATAAAPAARPAPPKQPAVTQVTAVAQPQPVKPAAIEPPAPAAAGPVPATVAEPNSAPAALTGVPSDEEAARVTRLAHEKAAAQKARKKRVVARERARSRAIEDAGRQQDEFYYNQRPAYAYAPPRPAYGPFSQAQGGWFGGGWGRGW